MRDTCSSTSRKWWHFVPSLSVWAAITWLSLIKAVPVPLMVEIPLADKWGHMLAYLVFALCLAGDCFRVRMPARTIFFLAALLPIVYGGLIELIQPHFPPRSGEWSDWLADCIGTGIGLALFAIFHLLVVRHKAQNISHSL